VALEGAGLHPAACGAFSVPRLLALPRGVPRGGLGGLREGQAAPLCGVQPRGAARDPGDLGAHPGAQHSHAAAALEEQLPGPRGGRAAAGVDAAIEALVREHNGGFEDLTCQIAVAYSRQVVHDWQVFLRYVLSRD